MICFLTPSSKRHLWKTPNQSVWFKAWVIHQASLAHPSNPPFTLGLNARWEYTQYAIQKWKLQPMSTSSEWITNIIDKFGTSISHEAYNAIRLHLINYFGLPLHIIVVEDSCKIEVGMASETIRTARQRLSTAIQNLAKGFGFQYHRVSINCYFSSCSIY